MGDTLGVHMSVLDIGGGYPGYCNEMVSLYKVGDSCQSPAHTCIVQIGLVVNTALDTHFHDRLSTTTVIAEPGRYFAMPSSCAVAQIFAKKSVCASDVKQGRRKVQE
jgi:diaminopimelate decarboxylase